MEWHYLPTQLPVIKVDVTNSATTNAMIAKAQVAFDRMDGVFNDAGVTYTSEVESVGEAIAREVFDIDFWGVTRVSAEAVRFLREVNKPKRALEVMSECLVGHLDPM
ncbi:hypothetical protein J3R83DRAFT_11363 [Lanmaoa asiatica]|nr:hypothetical protein J3R83DRAFT_11363 [Lanmaoa asiatica]